MIKLEMKRLLIFIAGVGLCGFASAQIVKNGDFSGHILTAGEDPWLAVSNNLGNAGDLLNAGQGWSYIGDPNNNVALISAGYLGEPLSDGQELDVSGGSDNYPSGITQDLTLVLGKTYTLSFEVFTSSSHIGGVDYAVSDGSTASFTGSGAGAVFTSGTVRSSGLNLIGVTDTTYTETFTAHNVDTSLSFYMPHDPPSQPVSQVFNVSVTPSLTPEPFTLALAIGGLGLGLRRRFARKA